ncbi:MAG: signal peptidase I [Bacilli bacterium]|nr:signal peptidase I [Bacilli bacterium]MDD4808910.1 signal peptidase I [Bacilli bacterium]
MKKIGQKVLSIILNILLWFVIIVAAVVTIISLNTREKGVSNVAGYIPFSIQSDSMKPELYTGDLIISKKYDGESRLKEGDIISFFTIEQEQKIIMTHRITHVVDINGMVSYVTKGDNNDTVDSIEVVSGDIISVYDGFKISKVGYALSFLKTQVGFFVCIILPLFIFFVFQLYGFIMLLLDAKHYAPKSR